MHLLAFIDPLQHDSTILIRANLTQDGMQRPLLALIGLSQLPHVKFLLQFDLLQSEVSFHEADLKETWQVILTLSLRMRNLPIYSGVSRFLISPTVVSV